jgi:hypothetical protein
MSASLLPQEIIDDIVRRADWYRSGSLALVSKVFRPQVQRLRFCHITLKDLPSERTERLSKVLARNPILGGHVQMVTLSFWYNSKVDLEETQAPGMLERILQACRIQTLMFSYGTVSMQIIQLIASQGLPHLRSLVLAGTSHAPMDALYDALSLCPPIDNLELFIDHINAIDIPQRLRRQPVRVKQLRLTVDRDPTEGSWTPGSFLDVEEELAISLWLAAGFRRFWCFRVCGDQSGVVRGQCRGSGVPDVGASKAEKRKRARREGKAHHHPHRALAPKTRVFPGCGSPPSPVVPPRESVLSAPRLAALEPCVVLRSRSFLLPSSPSLCRTFVFPPVARGEVRQ